LQMIAQPVSMSHYCVRLDMIQQHLGVQLLFTTWYKRFQLDRSAILNSPETSVYALFTEHSYLMALHTGGT